MVKFSDALNKKAKFRKYKNFGYTIIIMFVVSVFGHRFQQIDQENKFEVFNVIRNNLNVGTPVETLKMERKSGVLYEPLTVKNNVAFVSGNRVNIFKPGQTAGQCKIVSVSKKIDLDTGMYVIKTSKCQNGLQYIERKHNGFFVPVSAIAGNTIFVVDNGVAQERNVVIQYQDAQNALIKSGLQDGDVVILSNVKNNEKVQIIK